METIAVEELERYLIDALLIFEGQATSESVREWLEYQAFGEFVGLILAKGDLPEEYVLPDSFVRSQDEVFETHDDQERFATLRQYAQRRIHHVGSYKTQTELLFESLHGMGSPLADEICRLYCEHKRKIDFANEAAAAFLIAKGIIMDLWFGLPITTIIALLIKSGVLERLCECD